MNHINKTTRTAHGTGRDERNIMKKSILRTGTFLFALGLLSAPAHAGTIVTYVHTDHLGSLSAETDTLGHEVLGSRRSFTPYGENEQGVNDGPGYTGHYSDTGSGLVYMQARYYDPEIGRFLSVDPVTFAPDKLDHFNRYWYASGNPMIIIDPTGKAGDLFGDILNLGDFLSNATGDSSQAQMSDATAVLAMDLESSGAADAIEFGEAVQAGTASIDVTGAASAPGFAALGSLSYSGGDLAATVAGGACPTCASVQATADVSLNASFGPTPADGPVVVTMVTAGGPVGVTTTTTASTAGITQSVGVYAGGNSGVSVYAVTGYRKTIVEGSK